MSEPPTRFPLSFDERKAIITRSIERFYNVLDAFLVSRCRNNADAQDLQSKLWIYVLHKFRDSDLENFTLLRMKARSLFLDHYRKVKRSKEDAVEVLPELGQRHFGKEAHNLSTEAKLYRNFCFRSYFKSMGY